MILCDNSTRYKRQSSMKTGSKAHYGAITTTNDPTHKPLYPLTLILVVLALRRALLKNPYHHIS